MIVVFVFVFFCFEFFSLIIITVSIYYFPTESQSYHHHHYDIADIENYPGDDLIDSQSDSSSHYSSDYEKPKLKERISICCLKFMDILCVCDCFWCWIRVQELVASVVFDPFMELFITLCIVVNTLFMAMDHHNMDKDLDDILQKGNFVSFLLTKMIIFFSQKIFI